jgi:hypothetical protein
MKKIFTCSSILIGIIILQSCSKQSSKEMLMSPQVSSSIINATLKSNGTYQLTLDKLANVVIAKQASHFQTSQAGLDNKTGLLVYTYQPVQGYIGLDEVLLSTSKNVVSESTGGCSNGGSSYHTSTVKTDISIKLNVTGN